MNPIGELKDVLKEHVWDLFFINRFVVNVFYANFWAPRKSVLVGVGGQCDDLLTRIEIKYISARVEAVHHGHLKVRDDEGIPLVPASWVQTFACFNLIESFQSIQSFMNLYTGLFLIQLST